MAKFKRMRQMSPKKCASDSFRVKRVDENTELVICCPKGHYSPKTRKCKVGTRVQSVLKKK